jgi:hypothetical protein
MSANIKPKGSVMANREQRSNREKRKPEKDKAKTVSVVSPFSSVEAKAKAESTGKKGK